MSDSTNGQSYAASSGLGKPSEYTDEYSAELLHPIQRADYRATVDGMVAAEYGHDLWQCYELSWLDEQGLPQVAIARIIVPLSSAAIVESKSLKLYLNSLHKTAFASQQALEELIARDLSAALGAQVEIVLSPVAHEMFCDDALRNHADGLLDTLPVACQQYQRDPSLLNLLAESVQGQWHYSHLLRSHCPVTDQPDWGTLHIRYSGQVIEPASLLRYIVSYREHSGFHEQCVEQIYSDIMRVCKPDELTVYAQYTRRGGIDINPLRSNVDAPLNLGRVGRQ